MKIIKEEKLEELIVANWTQFVDIQLLKVLVKNELQKNLNNLIIIPTKRGSIKGDSISLSRFYSTKEGYYFWIEFYNLINNQIAEGTMEAFVPYDNKETKIRSIVGNLHPA